MRVARKLLGESMRFITLFFSAVLAFSSISNPSEATAPAAPASCASIDTSMGGVAFILGDTDPDNSIPLELGDVLSFTQGISVTPPAQPEQEFFAAGALISSASLFSRFCFLLVLEHPAI